ncbi:hypothetical protein PI124_g9731 [Phytophthora idaei]|nr:hypothetical protein PI125_g9490 [Phytophthora idaei]KAG3245524.1 hypothetical protein PI124_g9731 [Phytophthora idaei]
MAGAREKRRAKRVAQGGTYMWRSVWSELKAGGWAYPLALLKRAGTHDPATSSSDADDASSEPLARAAPTSPASGAGEGGAATVDDASEEEDEEDKYHLVPRGKRASSLAASNDGHSLFGSSDEDEIELMVKVNALKRLLPTLNQKVFSSLMSSDTDNDLNHVDEDDNPADFGGLDSGDEPEQDDIVDEDMPDETDE